MQHELKGCFYDVILDSIDIQCGFCDDEDARHRRNILMAVVGSGSKSALKKMLCDVSANGSWTTDREICVWVRPDAQIVDEAIKVKVASSLTETFMSAQWQIFNLKNDKR